MVKRLIPIINAEDLMTEKEEQEVINKMDEKREKRK